MMRVSLQENQTQQCLFLLLSYHLFTAPNHKTMHLQFLAFASPSVIALYLRLKKKGERQGDDRGRRRIAPRKRHVEQMWILKNGQEP